MHNKNRNIVVIFGIIIGLLFSVFLLFKYFFIPNNNINIVTVVINSDLQDSLNSKERGFIKQSLNKLNVQYRIIYKPFIELMQYVKRNDNTIGIGLIAKNTSRQQMFILSIPYEYSTIGFLYKKNKNKNKKYITIGAQSKTTLYNILSNNDKYIKQSLSINNYDILLSDHFQVLLKNLFDDKIDVIICDNKMWQNNPYKLLFTPLNNEDGKPYTESIVIIYNNVDRKIIDYINQYIRNKDYENWIGNL
jgi:hypothetical protein